MFKALRNKLLITNIIIIAALMIGCLTAIQLVTYRSVRSDIEVRLDRSVNMCMQSVKKQNEPDHFNEAPLDDSHARPQDKPPREPVQDRFSSDFSVYVDQDGDMISEFTNLNVDESDYTDAVKSILSASKEQGAVSLGTESWSYKRVSFGDGYIIAFAQDSAQKKILLNLGLLLIGIGILSIGLAFLISLYIANRSIKPIEESYNRQKRFVADASHELRTPLATINANADLLLSHPDSTIADEKKWIIYIKDETERMTGLTNDLLYLAKSDADREEKVSSSVSLSDITESTILETEAAAFEKGLELTYSVEPDITVIASQDRLKQLILILIDNALKYTPQKGKINISLVREGSKAIMRVENTGEGIAADELPHIFDRFYRTDKSRARESGGSGLGLSIAKSICKSINADICAESIPGKMTVFTVSFPASKELSHNSKG